MSIEERKKALTGENAEYAIYAPIVVLTDQRQVLLKKPGQLNTCR